MDVRNSSKEPNRLGVVPSLVPCNGNILPVAFYPLPLAISYQLVACWFSVSAYCVLLSSTCSLLFAIRYVHPAVTFSTKFRQD